MYSAGEPDELNIHKPKVQSRIWRHVYLCTCHRASNTCLGCRVGDSAWWSERSVLQEPSASNWSVWDDVVRSTSTCSYEQCSCHLSTILLLPGRLYTRYIPRIASMIGFMSKLNVTIAYTVVLIWLTVDIDICLWIFPFDNSIVIRIE